MREAGVCVNVEVQYFDDGEELELTASTLFVTTLAGERNYGPTQPSRGGAGSPLKMTQPLFRNQNAITGNIRVKSGRLFLFDTNGDLLIFGKATLVKGVKK